MLNKKYDVLIVGLGPTGMMLANELSKQGISFAIIDKRQTISKITRAVNITPATMATLEHSADLSVISELATKSDKFSIYWHNSSIADVNYQAMPFAYKKIYYLPQNKLEMKLLEKIKGSAPFLAEEYELINIEKLPNGCYQCEIKYDDEKIFIESTYIVACDGGKSTIREWCNIACDEEDYQSEFLLYDIETSEKITDDSLYYIYEDGYIVIAPISINLYRIVMSFQDIIPDPAQHNDINFLIDILYKKAKKAVNPDKLVWFTTAKFRHQLACQARHENMFFAGDALHLFSPIGGLNMHTGLQDVVNLGWKLAFVIKGYVSEDILDTYSHERSEIVQLTKQKIEQLTYLMTKAKTYVDNKEYLAELSQASSIQYKLPTMLSGYEKYSESSMFVNNALTCLFQVGAHFTNFIADTLLNNYLIKLVSSKKFTLLVPDSYLDKAITQLENDFQQILCIKIINSVNATLLPTLIRPDGFVALVVNKNIVKEINDFFVTNLGVIHE